MRSLRGNSDERLNTLGNIEIGSFNIKTEVSEFNAVETNRLQNSCDIFSILDVSSKFHIPILKPKLNLNSHRLKPKKKTEDTTITKDDDSADVPDEDSEHNWSSNFANNTGASWR